MTQTEIIIAHLKAQVLIEESRAAALRQYVYNNDFNLQAQICDITVKNILLFISDLKKNPE